LRNGGRKTEKIRVINTAAKHPEGVIEGGGLHRGKVQ